MVSSVRALYPGKKVTGVFQPHLYSRTKDFGEEFGQELSLLDEVVVLDIYPARELPIEGIDAEFILDKIDNSEKRKETKETLVDSLNKAQLEVVLTIGAGDINTLVEPIKRKLTQK